MKQQKKSKRKRKNEPPSVGSRRAKKLSGTLSPTSWCAAAGRRASLARGRVSRDKGCLIQGPARTHARRHIDERARAHTHASRFGNAFSFGPGLGAPGSKARERAERSSAVPLTAARLCESAEGSCACAVSFAPLRAAVCVHRCIRCISRGSETTELSPGLGSNREYLYPPPPAPPAAGPRPPLFGWIRLSLGEYRAAIREVSRYRRQRPSGEKNSDPALDDGNASLNLSSGIRNFAIFEFRRERRESEGSSSVVTGWCWKRCGEVWQSEREIVVVE